MLILIFKSVNMKGIMSLRKLVCVVVLVVFTSCDEFAFLTEKPLSIYTPENSLVSLIDFQGAINTLYNKTRYLINEQSAAERYMFWYGTDLAFGAADYYANSRLNNYEATMIPTYEGVAYFWRYTYAIVNQANLVLSHLENSSVSEADKKAIKGEALFFRAFGYRILANLFGGVPIILSEITEPKRDFVRATRTEVYEQAKEDLTEAVASLADVDKVKDGKVSKQVAQHLLAEICISLGEYDNAIAQATAVIDHSATGLMTERFGSKLNQPGDVCSDLHKSGNQNRSTSGNKETLWALQYDYLNSGSPIGDERPRMILPYYQSINITVKDESGKDVTTAAFHLTAEKGGRGIGWAQPTWHATNGIWTDTADLRNSSYNIVRDMRIDNEKSPAFGKWFVADGFVSQTDTIRLWYPFFMKVTGDIPEDLHSKDNKGNPLLTQYGEHIVMNAAAASYREVYVFRLAETYLLRAEAWLAKADKKKAAEDINVVRARALAEEVDPSIVDIHYLLDERLRELAYEELRMCTLCRMGKLVERNRMYNSPSGKSIRDYHDLWPIPYSEIENNIFAELEQNPGYTN